jgi:hypothetical protein
MPYPWVVGVGGIGGSGGGGITIDATPDLPVQISPSLSNVPLGTSSSSSAPTSTSSNLNWSVDTWAKTIPLSMGNRRIAGDLIWAEPVVYDGLGNATVSFAVSFGYPLDPNEYTHLAVRRVWGNGNLMYDGTVSPAEAMTGLTMRFYPGSRFQAVDSLISTVRGATVASAYRPMIYMVFDTLPLALFQNQVPFISAELIAQVGRLNVSDVIGAVALRSGYAAGSVVVSGITDQCDGAVEINDFTFQDFVTRLSDPYNFTILDGDTTIKIERRVVGSSLVIDATINDGICLSKSPTDDVVLLDRIEDTQLPYQVEVSYLDAAIDYQTTQQIARLPAAPVLTTPSTIVKRIDLPLMLSADDSLGLAFITLYRGLAEQLKLTFSLPPSHLDIEPGDVVELVTGFASYVVLILQSTITPQFSNDLVAKVLLTNTDANLSAISGQVLSSKVRMLTWDPLSTVNVTLSNGNITATPSALATAFAAVSTLDFKRSGRWYFEVTLNTAGANGDAIGLVALGGGVSDPAAIPPSNCALVQAVGAIYAEHNDPSISIGSRSSGDVIRVAVDLDSWAVWFAVAPSGNWNNSGSADPATGIGALLINGYADTLVGPFCAFNAASGTGVWTLNAGQSAFIGTLPSGYAAWTPRGDVASSGGFTKLSAALSTNMHLEIGALIAYPVNAVIQSLTRSPDFKNYGRYYFEVSQFSGGNDASAGAGIATAGAAVADVASLAPVNCAVVQLVGEIWSNGADSTKTLGVITRPNVIGVAVDFTNANVWFRIAPSGDWNGDPSADPKTNTGGVSFSSYSSGACSPCFGWYNVIGSAVLNAGNAPFIGAVPSGFTAGWPA